MIPQTSFILAFLKNHSIHLNDCSVNDYLKITKISKFDYDKLTINFWNLFKNQLL